MQPATLRPRIGLCACQATARWSVWNEDVVFVPRHYVRAVQRAGGAPLVLPPDDVWTADPDAVLDGLDGLILCGGTDVAPAAYGAEPHPRTDAPDVERDGFEIALARRALERDIPVLGVCRGMQLMNVAAGGTLVRHLPDRLGSDLHRHTPGSFADHPVALEEGSLAARAAGDTLHPTKSHHHQGIDRVGEGFEVTGWSVDDRVPEAIEAPERRFALGVQWHPEVDEGSRIIAALVEEAGRVLR
ncbi:MAG TPA: gamma-glutamyl-gamma-aminobutyrate hydrolase family protein [Solirubrobacteraceae bacterium]|nr:gamma-glutamyl-gamma-aminobutyrate hydrolase family protein [Solirubrobacteraceae bacterium]